MGPLLILEIRTDTACYGVGDVVPRQGRSHIFKVHVNIDFHVRKEIWDFQELYYTLRLIGNNGVLREQFVTGDQPNYEIEIPGDELLWIRAELKGLVRGVHTLIALTNAIYVDR
ncbi:hypothetical protein [Paenibacillus sp. V4I7]|uniref:hypothetical protein n=1 Tax=Paenibacillus sp. V4I7 TaxID=3042307 RepID=UPI002782F282|nr:hypothetical protein [Paenibacillus sp. V4I7]MDQ0897977.1 hypothetical protein [Paenibacillus sp. V4I7]